MGGLLAVVMGDMDLVRPVGEAGVSCAVVAHRGDATRWSRFTRAVIDADAPGLLDRLLEFGRGAAEPPLLFYEADWSLQLVSEHRDTLGEVYRFVLPERELVEQCLSKEAFRELAERCGLDVPRSLRVEPREGMPPPRLDFGLPAVAKPIPGRDGPWDAVFGRWRKAVRIDNEHALEQTWARLALRGGPALLQELIPGPESLIESYHAYVDSGGAVAAEFTGRKIRTFPIEYGASSALETTDAPDVVAAGREFVERTAFRGVLKADYKRRADGTLALLEVNPRFNLWHALGAKAGVNLPAFAIADLTGAPRPPAARARAGVTWSNPPADVIAARQLGFGRRRWLWWALTRCDVLSAMSLRDPLPFVRGKLLPRLLPGG